MIELRNRCRTPETTPNVRQSRPKLLGLGRRKSSMLWSTANALPKKEKNKSVTNSQEEEKLHSKPQFTWFAASFAATCHKAASANSQRIAYTCNESWELVSSLMSLMWVSVQSSAWLCSVHKIVTICYSKLQKSHGALSPFLLDMKVRRYLLRVKQWYYQGQRQGQHKPHFLLRLSCWAVQDLWAHPLHHCLAGFHPLWLWSH